MPGWKTTVHLLTALLKHQAKTWLGEEAAGVLADVLIDGELRARLDAWLSQEETQRRLQQAAQQAHRWLQDPDHCPDETLRKFFHSLTFGDLPTVQRELAALPQALDLAALERTLRAAFDRDLPRLSEAQRAMGARLYAEALLRALSTLKGFGVHPVRLIVFETYDAIRRQGKRLETIEALLREWRRRGEVALPSPEETLPGALPPGSYLPFVRNALFTGREAALATLAERLTSPTPPDPLPPSSGGEGEGVAAPAAGGEGEVARGGVEVITGMGGVGKTQLAVEFAYRYGYRFAGVHWLDLSDSAQLDEALARNGEPMGLQQAEGETRQAFAERVLRAWKAHGPRLLILDNFEDLGQAQEVLARLQHPHLRLLLTSRRKDWPPTLGLRLLPLDEFTPEESRAFLRRWLPPERATDKDLDALAARLGRLPLALELAGRYLHHLKRKTVAAYLAELERALEHPSMQGWKPAWGSPTDHVLNLAHTFALSWAQVESEAARRALVAAGYCAPDEPLPLDALEPLAGGADALDEAFADLTALGLLREGDPPTIHPLVAEFARGWDEEGQALAALAEALADVAERTNREEDRTGDYGLYTPLAPHVRAVAAWAEATAPEHAGRLWNSLGYHLHAVADYAGAQAAYERALKISEAVYGPEHPKVATAANNLGSVLRDLGDLQGAKAAFQRALRIDEALYGPEHPNVAIRVNNLGSVLRDLGDLQGAKAAFQRALRIDEALYGPEHPHVAMDVNNLGSVLRDLGDLHGAKETYNQALRIWVQVLGEEHPHVATLWNNLGSVLQDMGDLAGAKAAFERALRILAKFLPPEHPHVRIVRKNLEGVERELGEA